MRARLSLVLHETCAINGLLGGERGEVITDLFGPRLHNALGTWTFNVEWDREVGEATLERRNNLHPLLIEAFGDPE